MSERKFTLLLLLLFKKWVANLIEEPSAGGRIRNRTGGNFFMGEGNLRRSDFDNSNLIQSLKQLSVNTENQLKSEVTWPKCPKSMKLKQKGTAAMTTTNLNAVFIGL